MRTLTLHLCLVVLAAMAGAQRGEAQPSSEATRLWAAFGVGPGVPGLPTDVSRTTLVATVVQLVYQKRETHLALRLGGIPGHRTGEPNYWDLGVLYGRAALRAFGHATVAVGVAHSQICRANQGCTATLGIPIVAEIAFRPLPIAGVGVQSFATLNTKQLYAGLVVFVQAGWIPYG